MSRLDSELPGLVEKWAFGWTTSRRVSAPASYGSGWRIDVGLPGHHVRLVLPGPEASLIRQFTTEEAGAGAWLKVCAARSELQPLLSRKWTVGADEFLMSTELRPRGPRATGAAVPAYAPEVAWTEPGVVDVWIRGPERTPAASGRIALHDNVAIFDQVVTEPAHRRRGLGAGVVSLLGAVAIDHGATGGVLVATSAGRALYDRLGWTLRSPVAAARFADDAA